MSGSAPLVLSRNVRTVDDLQFDYSLSRDAHKPKPPPSRPLSIVSRRTFGVYPSSDADKAVNALHLETHLADAPALSHLTVRGEGAPGYMAILAVDDNLVVLDSSFPAAHGSPVYIVYDAVEQSITMVRSHPWLVTPYEPGVKRETADATSVLIARAPGGDGRSYALVNIAETSIYSGYDYEPKEKLDVLYVWQSSSRFPRWDLIRTEFPREFKGDDVANSYTAVLAFTCGGYAFWVNLLRGIMYCSLDALLPVSEGGPKLKFVFKSLPCQLPCPTSSAMELDSDMYRTIGRAGESSVKFVIIDGFVQLRNFLKCTLKVWSLSPDESMTRWTKRSLCLGSLADEFEKAGLPTDMVPMYPSVSAEEEDVVYFMLGEYKKCCQAHKRSMTKHRCNGYVPAAKKPLYHLRVDMRRGVLLASARLPDLTSPSVSIASTSVVPSSMIQQGSRARMGTPMMGKKDKRRCGDGNRKKWDRCAFSQ